MVDGQEGNVPVVPQDAGQHSAEHLQEGGTQQEQPQYVTRADFDSLRDELSRQVQSLTDKNASRIGKQVQEQLDSLEAQLQADNVKLSQGERDNIRAGLIREAVANASQRDGAQRQSASPQAEPDFAMAERIAKANMVLAAENAKYGVSLYKNDPEASMVDDATPESFAETYPAALLAKAQRLGRQPAGEGSAAARVAAGGKGTPAPNRVTELTQKLGNLMGDPIKNAKEITQTERELTAELKRQ